MQLPLLSYIAHLVKPSAEHIAVRDEMTERLFPCVISNDLNNGREFPQCEYGCAVAVNTMRLATLLNERTKYFIYFLENSSNDNIANVELGIALASKHIEHIIIIGGKRQHGFQAIERITYYPDWQNFKNRNFFDLL